MAVIFCFKNKMPKYKKLKEFNSDKRNVGDCLKNNDAVYVVDMDGTLYRGNILLDGVKEFINILNAKNYILMTNCPIHSAKQLSEKMKCMGIDVPQDKIITSAQIAVKYFMKNEIHTAFVIGSQALKNEVAGAGILITEQNPQCVLVGQDNDLQSEELQVAATCIKEGAKFYCTNIDMNIPYGDAFRSHTGRIVNELQELTREIAENIGKPERNFLDEVCAMFHCDIKDIKLIGDNLDTDIRMGQRFGATTYLLMTGIADDYSLTIKDTPKPDRIFHNIKELITYEFANTDKQVLSNKI